MVHMSISAMPTLFLVTHIAMYDSTSKDQGGQLCWEGLLSPSLPSHHGQRAKMDAAMFAAWDTKSQWNIDMLKG